MKEKVVFNVLEIETSSRRPERARLLIRIPNPRKGGRERADRMSRRGGRTIRVLNVAEKPSVAKAVAEILSRSSGGMRSRAGRSRYNRVFEFEYAIGSQACHMLVTSVTGHLMELEFEDRFRKWNSCDPVDLYDAPVRKFVPEVTVFWKSWS